MADGETLVIVGVLIGLVGATVVPFALPALQLGNDPVPTPEQDKSVPAGVSSTSTVTAARSTATAGTNDVSTGGQTATRTTRTTPQVTCDPDPHQELPAAFPLTLDGEPVTGDGVSVAIIDPSGFDVNDTRIAADVQATTSFQWGESADITNGGTTEHGTETAALVSRIAPGASLYLANFRKASDFTRAIEWAIEQEVDVIVAPTTFYAKPNDGSAPVSQVVSNAMAEGITVVVPTGNVATHHWEGTYEDGPWLEFSPNETRMYLRGTDRPVRTWLWWNETPESGPNEFRVVLYKDLGDASERISVSEDYPKGPVGANQALFEQIRSNNVLTRSIGNGTYYLRIKGPEGATHRVELVAAAHPLDDPVPRGSIMAPATATGPVIAVGAARASTGRARTTSSRGPTNDGRLGVDLLAPGSVTGSSGTTVTGTSTAAAYTGGVVALMKATNPSLPPGQVEAVLQATAGPATPPDDRTTTGHGRINPEGAVDCVAGMADGDGV